MTTTPEQFLALLTGSQEERDAAETIEPVMGHVHLLCHGGVIALTSTSWNSFVEHSSQCIATLDLASVLAEVVSYRRKVAWSLARGEKVE